MTFAGGMTGFPVFDSLLGLVASATVLLFTDVAVAARPSVFFTPSLAQAVAVDAYLAAATLSAAVFPALTPSFAGTDELLLQLAFFSDALSSLTVAAQPALFYTFITSVTPTFFPLLLALDPALVVVELFFVAALCLSLNKLVFFQSGRQLFYDDLVTLCKYNNLSLTEIAVTATLSVGFIFFDIFVSFGEEDVIDSLNYLILLFVILTFVFLILAVDVQYFFMVSNAGGDLTLRVIVFDLVNNVLCALRVFFCWVRYIFYDLQVELVDLSFHYTDSVNDAALMLWFDVYTQTTSAAPALNQNSLLSAATAIVWALGAVFLDVALYIFQALAGLFKLVIASFLLWLIVDLFLLRGFAHDESHGLTSLRASKKTK